MGAIVGVLTYIFRVPDDAMTFHQMSLASDHVRRADLLELTFSYDKRPECFGDDIKTAEYYVRFWYADGTTDVARRPSDVYSAKKDEAGSGRIAHLRIRLDHIPPPPLDPAPYDLQLVARIRCRGEIVQTIDSPTVRFWVIE